jgi:hypothetical protein
MPGIIAIVSAISDHVVAALAAAGYPSLVDGAILVGSEHKFEQSAPPRIIFTPKGSSFGAKNPAGASVVASNQPYSTEAFAQMQQRSIGTEIVTFGVSCWGCDDPPDPDTDFDVTQALYHQVIASTHLLCAGCYQVGGGVWTDVTNLVKDGTEFTFTLSFHTPILDLLLERAPVDVTPAITDTLQIADGTTEDGGCTTP